MADITPFTYINDINSHGRKIKEVDSSKYSQFLTNRNFSLFKDTILIANEANKFRDISDHIHFRFLKSIIKPGRRFTKWPKSEKNEKIKVISSYYNISNQKASEIEMLYNSEDIKKMEELNV